MPAWSMYHISAVICVIVSEACELVVLAVTSCHRVSRNSCWDAVDTVV